MKAEIETEKEMAMGSLGEGSLSIEYNNLRTYLTFLKRKEVTEI